MVGDPEAPAEVRDAGGPAHGLAAEGREGGEPRDRLRLRVEVGKLRPDVHVQPEHVEAARERVGEGGLRLRGREPELRAVVAGHHRLVRVGIDAERDADQGLAYPGSRRQLGLVRRIEDDGCAGLGRRLQQLGALVVAVDDEVRSRHTRSARVGELARRGHVRADALLVQQPQDGHVREGLRPVVDASACADRCPQRACLGAERRLAVDDEGRSEALGELVRRHASECEDTALERGGVGEEVGHLPILTVTISAHAAASYVGTGRARRRPRAFRWSLSRERLFCTPERTRRSMERYDASAIEEKWQRVWEDARAFHVSNEPVQPKSYVLEMLPYPSGTLHMGHMLVYTIGDVVTRFRSRNGDARPPPAGVRLLRPARGERGDQGGRPSAREHGAEHRRTSRARCGASAGRTTGRARSRRTIRRTTAGSSGSSCASSSAASRTARARR